MLTTGQPRPGGVEAGLAATPDPATTGLISQHDGARAEMVEQPVSDLAVVGLSWR